MYFGQMFCWYKRLVSFFHGCNILETVMHVLRKDKPEVTKIKKLQMHKICLRFDSKIFPNLYLNNM